MAVDLEEASNQRITYTPNTTPYTTVAEGSLWLKVESLPGAHQMHFFDLGASTNWNPRNISIYWTPAGGGQMGISWINSAGPTFSEWTASYSLPTGSWFHLYWAIDWTTNPDTALMWGNGSSISLSNTFGTNNQTPTGTQDQISIGGEHGSGTTGNYYDGLIAEVAVWSNAVGSSRMSGMYNSGAGGRADSLYPTNLTEYIRYKDDFSNSIGGSGTGLNSPSIVADHPFADAATTIHTMVLLGAGL